MKGVLAQLVERLNGIEEVTGSNPVGSTRFFAGKAIECRCASLRIRFGKASANLRVPRCVGSMSGMVIAGGISVLSSCAKIGEATAITSAILTRR